MRDVLKTRGQLKGELDRLRKRISELEASETAHKELEEALRAAVKRAEDERTRTEAIIKYIGEGISVQDVDFRILYQNQTQRSFSGDHAGEFCYKAYAKKDSVCEDCPVAMCYQDGKIHKVEKSALVGKKLQHVEISASPLRDINGEITGGIEIVRDITERKRAEADLKLFKNLINQSNDAIFVIDPETSRFLDVNVKACGSLGYNHEELIKMGATDIEVILPNDFSWKEHVNKVREKGYMVFEGRHRRKDGKVFPVEVNVRHITHGEKDYMLAVVRDITERKKMEEEFKKLATVDPLTKAYNRTKFDEIIIMEMERAKRFLHLLSFIMFDLDHFKQINDTYGHIVGDYVLKTTVSLIRKHIRKTDYLIRWGGEEFMIISPETGIENAKLISERIRETMEHHCFNKVGKVTGSFGITEFRKGDDVDDIIKRVDDALYKAKARGRNRVETSA